MAKGIKGKHIKFFALLLTVGILGILILAGPANAFVLNLVSDKTVAGKSEKIVFSAGLNINSGENLPIKNISLILTGSEIRTCTFDITGKAISGCFNINIKKVGVSEEYGNGYGYYYGYDYGYNYRHRYNFGYGYGVAGERNLTYEITIHSQHFLSGDYSTRLEAQIGDKKFSTNGPGITINSELKKKETKEYNGTEQEIEFNETKTKFKIKTNNHANGNVYVSQYSELPGNVSGFSIPSLKFFEVEVDDSILNEMNESEIRVYYTDEEVSSAGINEASLRLYYYNATSGTWKVYDSPLGGVNMTENYVWAITNHFSLWGVFGSAPEVQTTPDEESSPGNGCSTKWKCSEWSACINGEQSRTCEKEKAYCFAKDKPEETRTCLEPVTNNQEKELEKGEKQTKKPSGFFSGITGAVTGVFDTGKGIIAVVFIVFVTALTATTLVIRKKRKEI